MSESWGSSCQRKVYGTNRSLYAATFVCVVSINSLT